MTDCCVESGGVGRVRNSFGASEATYAEMVTRGVYRVVTWIADTYREWSDCRRAMKALDSLERLDDRRLADIGLRRDDLTLAAFSLASAKRGGARAEAGCQA